MARDPARRNRRDRRLQGGGAGAPRHRGRPLRARGADAREPAVRGPGDLRGRDRRARAGRRVRARPRARRLPGRPGAGPRRRSPTSSWCARADVLCVAPASANTIAKLAHGLADNLLTSAALACTAPLVLAPGDERPHVRAPGHPGEPRAAARARRRDRAARAPARSPRRASGAWAGWPSPARHPRRDRGGARPAPFAPRSLDGLRVLVTAGGTREPIDSVRYVGNRSSGRMGLALAEEAARRGAEVTLVAANVALPAPAGVRVRRGGDRRRAARPRPARSSPTPTCC